MVLTLLTLGAAGNKWPWETELINGCQLWMLWKKDEEEEIKNVCQDIPKNIGEKCQEENISATKIVENVIMKDSFLVIYPL